MTEKTNFAVEVSGLVKKFSGATAVDGLSFEVARGEIFGLVGPDGAGKTTTLRILAGVLPADAGSVRVAGCDVTQEPERVKSLISYMPQRFGLYEDLTVEENIRFYGDLFGVKKAERETRQTRLLAASGMSEFKTRLAGKLSGGMKQKLGLTCALIHTPKVILLDEPTNGVDPVSRRDFWRILYNLVAEGVAIVISTSYLDEAERCHRLALVHEGRVLLCDTPAALKEALPGAMLAVRSAEPRRVYEAIRDAAGIRSALLVGDGVHASVDDADLRAAEIIVRLGGSGIPFSEVVQVTPSIEDLFVATVEASGQANSEKT
jgi:ABC-2 type transport system ATP-binding protein